MDQNVALALAKLAVLHHLWKSYKRGSASETCDDSPPKYKKPRSSPPPPPVELNPEPQVDRVNAATLDGPRPKREAAVDALERVKFINKYLRQTKRLFARKERKRIVIEDSESEAAESAVETEDDGYYSIDSVLDEKFIDGERFLLLQWSDMSAPSWEPAQHLYKCDSILKAFNKAADAGFCDDD